MNFRTVKQIGAWLFPAHAWSYTDEGDCRTCEVCGRTEEFDAGGGMAGSAWYYVERGSRMAHVRGLPARVQPAVPAEPTSWSSAG